MQNPREMSYEKIENRIAELSKADSNSNSVYNSFEIRLEILILMTELILRK